MKSQSPSLSFQHKFFQKNRTPTVNKHARLERGQPQMWKQMKFSQLEKQIQQTLPNAKDIIQKQPKLLALKWPAQINRSQPNEAWALYKSNPSRVTWRGLFSDLQYRHLLKVSLCCWRRICSRAIDGSLKQIANRQSEPCAPDKIQKKETYNS